mmetsp:Transcript_15243/g.32342  ORF Transcript_15243/g.32342 Transcript_15243/m.32342 type:complete len:234 (+) Transcript_15243:2704-3405(+)
MGDTQNAGNNDHSSTTRAFWMDISAAVRCESADAASHFRARRRTRPWKKARRVWEVMATDAPGDEVVVAADCFINGRSHALSSRMPPPVVPLNEDFSFLPLSSSPSSSTNSTTERNISTPIPRTTVDVAYSTAVLAVPSFATSPCKRSNDDTRVLIHDCTLSSNSESSPPDSLFCNRQVANVDVNVAYPPERIDPHALRYLMCIASRLRIGMHCGNTSDATRRSLASAPSSIV